MSHSATGRNSSPLTWVADKGGYGEDDTVDDEESDDHTLLDNVQLSWFSPFTS